MAKNYSGLTRKQVVVGAYEVTTVDLYDSGPNYFRVLNHGDTRIYCGVTKIPNKNDYDFACDGGNVKMFAEPYKRSYLYIYNPTGTPVKVDVLSFYAEFDPLTLAFSELKLDLSGYNFETNTAIDSFQCALPEGTNNIGKVAVSNWPSDYAKEATINAIKTAFNTLIQDGESSTNYNLYDINSTILGNRRQFIKYARCKSGTATTAGTTYAAVDTICEIGFFSNDGSADITLTFIESNGTENSMVIKAGEVLNNIPCTLSSIKVAGDSVAYRLLYCERN